MIVKSMPDREVSITCLVEIDAGAKKIEAKIKEKGGDQVNNESLNIYESIRKFFMFGPHICF